MELDDAATILSGAEYFAICDSQQQKLLAFTCERRTHEPGDIVFDRGDKADGAYVLISGTLRAEENAPDSSKSQELDEPGAVVGEMALIVDHPRRVRVVAANSAETLFVPRSAFLKLMRQYPDLALRAAERIKNDMGDYVRALDMVRRKILNET